MTRVKSLFMRHTTGANSPVRLRTEIQRLDRCDARRLLVAKTGVGSNESGGRYDCHKETSLIQLIWSELTKRSSLGQAPKVSNVIWRNHWQTAVDLASVLLRVLLLWFDWRAMGAELTPRPGRPLRGAEGSCIGREDTNIRC